MEPSRRAPLSGRWPLILAILLLALAVRLALAIYADAPPGRGHDTRDFLRIGQAIAAGEGYPPRLGRASALRPPLYPGYLGLTLSVAPGGAGLTLARVGQAVMGTALVALIGLVAARIWGRGAGLVALALAAVYPPFLLIGWTIMSEALLLPLVVAAFLALLYLRRAGSLRWALATGALVGLAALTRANAAVLIAPALLALGWRSGSISRSLGTAAAMVAAFAAVLAPWAVRNAQVMHAFVPLSTQTGVTLAGTYNPVSAADRRYPASWRPPSVLPENAATLRDPRLGEAEVDRIHRSRALEYLRAHPPYVGTVAIWNSLRLLELQAGWSEVSARLIDIRNWMVSQVARFALWCLLLAVVFGLASGVVRRGPVVFWLFPLVLFLSVVVVQSETRFRLPIDPFLVIFAGATVAAVLDRASSRRSSPGDAHRSHGVVERTGPRARRA